MKKKILLDEYKNVVFGFFAWLLAFEVIAVIDEAVGYWLTDHEATKIIIQCVIQSSFVGMLMLRRAKALSTVVANVIVFVFIWRTSPSGVCESQMLVMLLSLIPFHCRDAKQVRDANEDEKSLCASAVCELEGQRRRYRRYLCTLRATAVLRAKSYVEKNSNCIEYDDGVELYKKDSVDHTLTKLAAELLSDEVPTINEIEEAGWNLE